MWGTVLKRDLLGETREEDKFHNKEELKEYLKSEIEKQGENVVIRNLDVSLIEDLSDLFYEYRNIRTLDLSGWKTSNVENMKDMFFSSHFNGDISQWDVSRVVDMGFMFYSSDFNGDISDWNVSRVVDMDMMFEKSKFSGDLSKWDVSNILWWSRTFYESPLEGKEPEWYKRLGGPRGFSIDLK